MTRPPIAKPSSRPIGAAVIVDAGAATARDAGGRALAQLEHNAMVAVGLTRAAQSALQALSETLSPAAELASRVQTFVDEASARELRRCFGAVKQQVESSAYAGHALLQGGTLSFALDDPWLEASELSYIELPDLSASVLSAEGLGSLDLGARSGGLISLRIDAVRNAIARGHSGLSRAARQLEAVVLRLNARRSSPPPALPAEQFADFTGRVRDHVLRSGASALRVQGAPSTKAASLIEGVDYSGGQLD